MPGARCSKEAPDTSHTHTHTLRTRPLDRERSFSRPKLKLRRSPRDGPRTPSHLRLFRKHCSGGRAGVGGLHDRKVILKSNCCCNASQPQNLENVTCQSSGRSSAHVRPAQANSELYSEKEANSCPRNLASHQPGWRWLSPPVVRASSHQADAQS